MTSDYFDMIERRNEHPRSLIRSSDESDYNMQLDAFIKQHGPFESVVRHEDGIPGSWSVVATREDGTVVRGAFMRTPTARRTE